MAHPVLSVVGRVPRRRLALAGLLAAAALAAGAPRPASAEAKKDWKTAAARVDDLVAAHMKTQKDLVVAPRADDAEFLRRVTLDLTGTIPTEAEAVAFLKDPAPEKRSALVDRLLASPRHADWFAMWYGNLLVGSSIRNRNLDRRSFNDWLRDQFRRNRPYDELAYDLITAQGNSEENGAIGFVSNFEFSAADAVGKTSKYFLGVQIQCAQCHDHPYDKRIKKEDFASFAAFFFTTTHRRNMSANNAEISFDVNSFLVDDVKGGAYGRKPPGPGMARGIPLRLEAVTPKNARGMPLELPEPKLLLGKTLKDVPGIDRRTLLAKWMTSKSNEWFQQAFANRMWAYLMGRGIVHPTDDFTTSNRPSNPELMKFLGEELVRGDFDVNHLIRTIVNTEAYQRTSKMPRDLERPEPSLYAVASVKPLSVEQSFDALFRATGAEKEVERAMAMGDRVGRAGGRGQLVDPRMLIYQQFRRSFDDDEQVEEETFTGTIPRGLLMMNGQRINQMMSASGADSPLHDILASERSDRERIRRLYLTVLTREPSPGELSNALQHVHQSRTETEGYEDLLWALCNTTEFMSNH